MALRLVRQTSDTPNVTNKDDTIMARYAYGGYNGVVKGFGSECGYSSSGGTFRISSGRIIVDGWEIDVDGAGWSLDVQNVVGIQYYSIFLQIDVATESVKIMPIYSPNSYPEIELGNDLTAVPNGYARILLYNVSVTNGVIVDVIKKFEIIPRLAQTASDIQNKIVSIEQRLDELGFKEGVASVTANGIDLDTSGNSLKKQGKYCLFNLTVNSPISVNHTVIIPEGFRPNKTVVVPVLVGLGNIYYSATINQNGNVVFGNWVTVGNYYQILNAGWEIE